MARENETTQPGREGVISIIGPGMRVVGDCESEGTLRIEGRVEGSVRAAKAVVVGKDGFVDGDIVTQDAVVGGRVTGSIAADSRLELQATCFIEGEIRARRIKLEEGGVVNGKVSVGEGKGDMAGRRSAIHRTTNVTEDKPTEEKPQGESPNAAAGGT
ncbi:MAG: polymer-forming cytoskeletal protein [Gemmatimonadota bacterium]